MTTVAVDRFSIACDRQFTHSGGHCFRGKTKIYMLPTETSIGLFGCEMSAIGFAGNADQICTALDFLFDQEADTCPKIKGLEMVAITSKKEIWTSFTLRNWMLVDQPYYAIGSGTPFALGALEAGKTPLQACKVASKMDANTGMGFREIVLNQ